MQQVISEKDARAITGGRKPLVPVVYEQAVKALAECLSLDEAKQWDNKADALAAWAKIYHDKSVERQARALKLLAYRRIGDLARELKGDGPRYVRGKGGATQGARGLLREHGFGKQAANVALKLSRIEKDQFDALANMQRPPSPFTAVTHTIPTGAGSEAWQEFSHPYGPAKAVNALTRPDPRKLCGGMTDDELRKAITKITHAAEWCDQFLQYAEKMLARRSQ